MIISHKHKFIFVKTIKTAGTSFETFLASYCGEDDIVTPIGIDEEMIRRELNIYPRNYIRGDKFVIKNEKDLIINSEQELEKFRKQNRRRLAREVPDKSTQSQLIWRQHTLAKKIKRLIDKDAWNNYYKFCFDRNPWDRTLSAYYFSKKHRNVEFVTNEQVYDFLKRRSERKKGFCNSRFYTDDSGRIILDDIYDFDHLDDSLVRICDKLGFDPEKFKTMPKFKSTIRTDRRPYDEFLTQQTIDFISDIHRKAIDKMNYKSRPSKVQGS